MAIYRLLKTLPMGPEEIAVLTDAYEHTLRKLNLVERSDPITQLIAKKIIEIHQRGERNPQNFYEGAWGRVSWSPSENSDDPSCS
jgi:hypothetical protein